MSHPDPMLPVPWRVADRWDETRDTFSFLLEPAQPQAPFRFLAGQFNMLYAFGTGESAISLSGDPNADDGRLIHTIRRVGAVTSALSRLSPGSSLGLRGPFGNPWPMEALRGRDLVFIAGGIGLAPLRPAILQALANRGDYGRIHILVGARAPEDALYLEQLKEWNGQDRVNCQITVDRAGEDWTGRVGVVTKLIPMANLDPSNTVALICGPEIMMRYTAIELRKLGVTDDRILVTMERNMKCAIGFCGHCQFGPEFICKDGPVFRFDRIAFWFDQREV